MDYLLSASPSSTAAAVSTTTTAQDAWWPFPGCPSPYHESYCLNGGQCFSTLFALAPSSSRDAGEPNGQKNYGRRESGDILLPPPRPFTPYYCRCAENYHGRRCEYLFNSELYGFMVSSSDGDNDDWVANLNHCQVVLLVGGIFALSIAVISILIFLLLRQLHSWRASSTSGRDKCKRPHNFESSLLSRLPATLLRSKVWREDMERGGEDGLTPSPICTPE